LYLDTLQATFAHMIRRFRHKGLQRFFETGSKAGIQTAHTVRLRAQLARLDKAVSLRDMDLPNWRLHPLKGNLAGHWAVWVDENWRLTFTFEGEDATLVDYQDYH
jgi:proteic killer suppression protein